jgi:PAS domain-containing protein
MAEQIEPPAGPAVNPDVYRVALEHIDAIVYCVAYPPQQGAEARQYVQGTVLFVSGRVSAVIGYEPDDFTRDPSLWFRSVHPEDASNLLDETERIIRERQPRTRHYRLRHGQTCEYRWLEDKVVPTFGPDGAVVGQVGVARDAPSACGPSTSCARAKPATPGVGCSFQVHWPRVIDVPPA